MPSHMGDDSAHPVSVHIAGVKEDGSMFIADLWESAEAFAAFAESEIVPAADERLGEIEPKFTPGPQRRARQGDRLRLTG